MKDQSTTYKDLVPFQDDMCLRVLQLLWLDLIYLQTTLRHYDTDFRKQTCDHRVYISYMKLAAAYHGVYFIQVGRSYYPHQNFESIKSSNCSTPPKPLISRNPINVLKFFKKMSQIKPSLFTQGRFNHSNVTGVRLF